MATNLQEAAMRPNDWFESVAGGANAVATATRAAPGPQRKHVLRDVIITLSGTPTTAAAVTVAGDVASAEGGPSTTTLHTIPVGGPSQYILPVNLLCAPGAQLDVAVAALGAGVSASITITGTTTSA